VVPMIPRRNVGDTNYSGKFGLWIGGRFRLPACCLLYLNSAVFK
jgi:hypothetical protein